MQRIAAPLFVLVLMSVAVAAVAEEIGQGRYESDLYFIVLAEHGPNWKSQGTEEGAEKKLQAIRNLRSAIGEGAVVIAGLVVDDVAADFVMIVDGDNEAAVRKALENAPLVKEGFYKLRALAWHAPKGLKLDPVPLKK